MEILSTLGTVGAFLALGWRYITWRLRAKRYAADVNLLSKSVQTLQKAHRDQLNVMLNKEEEIVYWRDLHVKDLTPSQRVVMFTDWQLRQKGDSPSGETDPLPDDTDSDVD
jgi:hypothetical protein